MLKRLYLIKFLGLLLILISALGTVLWVPEFTHAQITSCSYRPNPGGQYNPPASGSAFDGEYDLFVTSNGSTSLILDETTLQDIQQKNLPIVAAGDNIQVTANPDLNWVAFKAQAPNAQIVINGSPVTTTFDDSRGVIVAVVPVSSLLGSVNSISVTSAGSQVCPQLGNFLSVRDLRGFEGSDPSELGNALLVNCNAIAFSPALSGLSPETSSLTVTYPASAFTNYDTFGNGLTLSVEGSNIQNQNTSYVATCGVGGAGSHCGSGGISVTIPGPFNALYNGAQITLSENISGSTTNKIDRCRNDLNLDHSTNTFTNVTTSVNRPLGDGTGAFVLCNQVKTGDQSKCQACEGAEGIWTAVGCIKHTPESIVKQVVTIGLSLGGGVALLMILASAFLFSTSQGDPKRVTDARELLTSAVVGLLFIIFSITILQFIGVTILQIPGFGGP